MKSLEILHYPPPIVTNAFHNYKMAIKCYEAGIPPEEIAERYPRVFTCSDGKLSQIFDSIYKGTELKETKYTILESDVEKFIGGE